MSEKEEESYYNNLIDLAKNAKTLMVELLKDRVLRFVLARSLEINTYFLNYFLVLTY